MNLRDAVWSDVEKAERGVLVVPAGALEQHGHHLPLDTDTTLAAAVAGEIHRQRPGSGLAPALAIGASGEHADFPGTLSIGTAALSTVIVELVRDASRFWPAVLVVNGHGGNLEALRAASAVCAHEGRRFGVVHLALPGMDAHAGRTETSLMLHVDPARVRLDAAVPGPDRPVAEYLDRLRAQGVRAVSPTGVLGDPAGAGADEGAALFARLVTKALATHDRLTAPPPLPLPPPEPDFCSDPTR